MSADRPVVNWRLRRASPADTPALALVAAASFLETFAGTLPGDDIVAHVARKSTPEVFARWIADAGSAVTLATHPDGDAPVGYTVLTIPEDVGAVMPGDIELRRIYTLSPARGTGLGAALLARAIADARALGCARMLLGVLERNRRACEFYARSGFAVVGRRRFLVGATCHDDLIYARGLDRPD